MSPWRVKGHFRRDSLFVAPVRLNGRSFSFLFDPGAAYLTINPDVATILDLRVIDNQPLLQGAYYPINCPVYQVPAFQIGFIHRTNVRIVGMPLDPRLDFIGLLGMDFLRQYRFTLEPDTATLILRPRRK